MKPIQGTAKWRPSWWASALVLLLAAASACSSNSSAGKAAGSTTTQAASESQSASSASTAGSASPSQAAESPRALSSVDAGSYAPVFAAIQGLTGDARVAKLQDMAKAEGNKLTFYTAASAPLSQSLVDGFKKAYGIDVSMYRSDQLTVTQKILQESKADKGTADFVYSVGTQMVALSEAGMFVPDNPPDTAGLLPGTVRKDGWIADQQLVYVLAWNKNLVKSGQQPTSWEDLANPKWKGHLAIDVKDPDWYMSLFNYWAQQGKSPSEIDALFKAIFSNATATNGTTATDALLGAGQYEVYATDYWHTAEASIKKGAPITFTPPVQPLFSAPQGSALVKGAAHPAAAVLFAEWLISQDGQKVMADSGSIPVMQALVPDAFKPLNVIQIDATQFQDNYNKWQSQFANYLDLASKSK